MSVQPQMSVQSPRPAFGTLLTSHMAVATYSQGRWSKSEIKPVGPIELSPAAHVLHYASTCFEGFKAFRRADGSVHVFRMDRHIQRMQQSARQLVLPQPDAAQLADMVRAVIDRCRDAVPEAPGALYLRPILFGTTANIGAAATPAADASLLVLASPVWDYFSGGMKPLRILVDDQNTRSAAQMGMVKTGGNYAAALGPTLRARAQYQVDQVLFCPGGQVQETGAANFVLIRERELLTRSLDSTFLHGVTRDSLLTLARDLDYQVSEREFDVEEMLEWVKSGEAALSGTAAVLAGVGTLIYHGTEHRVAGGEVGPLTRGLRAQLVAVQQGEAPDRHGWLERV
ncbi:MAG TPA: branched-chain amino acid aminotransferase [Steroidobacteraceae bacterium]|jgi:branched-chain amino acid aminotransferase|nr:branched-chain amino acid aminotransferase [Steroidobacteraceae bacterium]